MSILTKRHQASISIAVRDPSGKLVMESLIETKAATILEFLQGLKGTLWVMFEEGTSAAWLWRESVQPVGRGDWLGCVPGGLPRCDASRLTRARPILTVRCLLAHQQSGQ
jgi:hypothetical protein